MMLRKLIQNIIFLLYLYCLFTFKTTSLIFISTNISCYLWIWTKWLFFILIWIFFPCFSNYIICAIFSLVHFSRAVKASKFFIAGTMNKRVKLSKFHIFLMNLLLLIQQKIYILKF